MSPSSLPRPPAGAVQVIAPDKAGPGKQLRLYSFPASTHAPDRGDITRGGGRGGNPLPVEMNHTSPPPGFPRRIGSSRGESPGRAQAWEGEPGYRFPIPHPRRRQCRYSPGSRPRSRPSPASSHAPDRGDITRGGAGEGTPSPPKRTILALPRGSRAGSGALVVRAREGRKPGKANQNTAFLSPTPGGGSAGDSS